MKYIQCSELIRQKTIKKINVVRKLLSLPTEREGNVFTGVCLSTIGLMDTGSLLGLVMAWSVRILLECFLVNCAVKLNYH